MSCFITGTGTGVGKTVVTAGLAGYLAARGQSVCVYKPVQTGATPDNPTPDLSDVRRWAGQGVAVHGTYTFADPAAPYAADPGHTLTSEAIIEDFLRLRRAYDVLLVEGAGGARVPMAPGLEMIDLMRICHLPVLIVASPFLGTINHTLLTLEALERRQIDVHGVVISGMPADSEDPAVRTLLATLTPFAHVSCWTLPEFDLQPGCFAPGQPTLAAFEALAL